MRVGVDLVDVARFRSGSDREGTWGRLFTPGELIYCRERPDPAPHLAARWAAKEALFKALGTGCRFMSWWQQVEVVHGPDGAPALRLSGEVAGLVAATGAREVQVSLSHLNEVAIAVVILAP